MEELEGLEKPLAAVGTGQPLSFSASSIVDLHSASLVTTEGLELYWAGAAG